MKLTDLNPRWFAEDGRQGQGVTFDCPGGCCAGKGTRLAATFANPVDGGAPLRLGKFLAMLKAIANGEGKQDFPGDVVPPGFLWQRAGDTFDVLTLAPSVDASASGHWHGFIQEGQIR